MFNNYLNRSQKDMKVINYILCNPELDLKYDDIEIYEIYLPLYHKLCYDKCEEMDKRLWLFTATSFKEMKVACKEEDNIKIIKELERLSMNNKFKDEYDYENVQRKLINSAKSEGYEDGIKEGMQVSVKQGIKKGKEQGVKQERIEIAKKLLSEKVDITIISKVTNLTINEINLLT